jgi:hypothetical protein
MPGKTNKNYYGQKTAGKTKDRMHVKVTNKMSDKYLLNDRQTNELKVFKYY